MRQILTVVTVIVCATAIWGQTNKGGISGTVTDQNGAVVPGATVLITNLGTNQTMTLTTSDSGVYTVKSLDPVDYSVQVERAGFKKTSDRKGEGRHGSCHHRQCHARDRHDRSTGERDLRAFAYQP